MSYNVVATLFSAHGIARLAVPTFFLISGYFFFYQLKKWDKSVYFGKLRKRLHTLLIPYLLWNGIPVLGIIIVRLLIGMRGGDSWSMVKEFGIGIGWLRALWDCGTNGHPFDVPLWYVRDLMVCSVCSPVIYLLLKKLGLFYILLLGCLFLTNTWVDVAGFDSRAWFFFSFGAYMSVNNVNMVCMFRKYAIVNIPLAIVLLIGTTFFSSSLVGAKSIADNLFLFLGVGALTGCFSFLVSKGLIRSIPLLTKSVFFVYAFHLFPLPGIVSVTALCRSLTGKMIVETQTVTYFCQLVLCPIAVLGVCLAIYYIMNRYTPKVLSVLSGLR